jgi:hypothetical protein
LIKKKTIGGETIFDATDNYVNSFLYINVVVPRNYPKWISLFETSNKFEHIPDRHINEEGCCVCSLQESDLISQKVLQLKISFKICCSYLANQRILDSEQSGPTEIINIMELKDFLQFYRELFEWNLIKK